MTKEPRPFLVSPISDHIKDYHQQDLGMLEGNAEKLVQRYAVIKRLGVGCNSFVVKVLDSKEEKSYALKITKATPARKMLNVARMLEKVEHLTPCILKIRGFKELDKIPEDIQSLMEAHPTEWNCRRLCKQNYIAVLMDLADNSWRNLSSPRLRWTQWKKVFWILFHALYTFKKAGVMQHYDLHKDNIVFVEHDICSTIELELGPSERVCINGLHVIPKIIDYDLCRLYNDPQKEYIKDRGDVRFLMHQMDITYIHMIQEERCYGMREDWFREYRSKTQAFFDRVMTMPCNAIGKEATSGDLKTIMKDEFFEDIFDKK